MIEKSAILCVQYYISRVYRLTDIRLVSRWVRSNDAKRTGKAIGKRRRGFHRERKSERERDSQWNRWVIGWTVWRRLDFLITAGIGSRYARRGNVVTGNGIALRRCSPDGRTNVRVLLFQLCGLPVLPLRLFHLRLALSYNSATHVRLRVLPFTSIDPISFFFGRDFHSRLSEGISE